MKEARAGHAVSIVGLKDYDAWCNLRGMYFGLVPNQNSDPISRRNGFY